MGREVSRVAAWGLFVFRLLIAGAIATILSSAAMRDSGIETLPARGRVLPKRSTHHPPLRLSSTAVTAQSSRRLVPTCAATGVPDESYDALLAV